MIYEHGPVILARHPDAVKKHGNESHLDDINADPPLSKIGIEQGRQLGALFVARSDIGLIITSHKERARHAADIARTHKRIPVVVSKELCEVDWGECSGEPKDKVFTPEMDARAREEGLDFRIAPSAETWTEKHIKIARVIDCYRDVFPILVLGHGQSTQAYVAGEMGWDRQRTLKEFKPRNAEAYDFDPLLCIPPERIFQPTLKT